MKGKTISTKKINFMEKIEDNLMIYGNEICLWQILTLQPWTKHLYTFSNGTRLLSKQSDCTSYQTT